jgi:thioredoxin-related protein
MKRSIPLLVLFSLLSLVWLTGCGNAKESSSRSAAPPQTSTGEPASWLVNFDEAKLLAAEKKRPVLVNFTGSDWCPPCIQMKKDVLGKEVFLDFAAENLVLLELDFPKRKPQPEEIQRQNEELAGKLKMDGFPTFLLLTPEGEELARHSGYLPGGPERFIQWTETARKK